MKKVTITCNICDEEEQPTLTMHGIKFCGDDDISLDQAEHYNTHICEHCFDAFSRLIKKDVPVSR